MSDGPHKSLPMRRGWKKFAARADKAVFEPNQVAEAVAPALEGDWEEEVASHLNALRGVVGNGDEPSLFQHESVSELESLKRDNPGNSLWCALIDNVIQAVLAGHAGRDALLAGARATLFDRAARGICQVEEHYLRRTTEARTERLRARMHKGIASAPIETLARRLVGLESPNAASRPPKREGLDDGVRL